MNLLFDLDGTLTDPRVGIVACLKYAIESMGQTPPGDQELVRFIGPPLQDSLALLPGIDNEERVTRAVAFYRERFAETGLYENTVYPDIPHTLEQLIGRGATLYVATSKPTVYAARIIEHFGLSRYFRGVYGSELNGTRSSKSELIAHLLNTESMPAASAVIIGDRSHDMAGARANRVLAIGVLWGYGTREELVTAGADSLCEQPALLVDAVPNTRARQTTK
jgi:phosphoglycolate phosphatase